MAKEFLITIITSAAVSSALAGLLLWLMKSWVSERLKNAIKNEYDQKLETHKSQLKAQSDIEIEKLRSNLSIAATEQNVKFSKLHNDRAEVIASTYSLLKEAFLTVEDFVKIGVPAGDKPIEERRQIAVDAHNEFRAYYPKKLIYLPKVTADKIEAINIELIKTFNEFDWNIARKQLTSDTDKWLEIFKRMKGEILDTLQELEDQFRELLGDKI
jgi:hypothetical protein